MHGLDICHCRCTHNVIRQIFTLVNCLSESAAICAAVCQHLNGKIYRKKSSIDDPCWFRKHWSCWTPTRTAFTMSIFATSVDKGCLNKSVTDRESCRHYTGNCDVKLRVGRFNSNEACCLLNCQILSCIPSWSKEPKRCMHCKCADSSIVVSLIVPTSVTWNKYQYHYWCCWVDDLWGMHCLTLSNDAGTALFDVRDEILHRWIFAPAWPIANGYAVL